MISDKMLLIQLLANKPYKLKKVIFFGVFLLIFTEGNPAFAKRRALIIGIDGCTGDQLQQRVFQDHRAPNIEKLMTKGQFASCQGVKDVKCARTQSGLRIDPHALWQTAPGWASVVTGVDINRHGVTENGHTHESRFAGTTKKFPTFFSVLKKTGFKTAAGGVSAFLTVRDDDGIHTGVLDYECGSRAEESVVAPDAHSSCNLNQRFTPAPVDETRDEQLVDWMSRLIETAENDVIMGVLDKVDSAGHAHGFSPNRAYMEAITSADTLVGKLIQSVERRVSAFHEEWLVILTSDHGGHKNIDEEDGGSHNNWLYQDEIVPFTVTIFSEANLVVRKLRSPVRVMDTAPTVLHWFGQACRRCTGKIQGL